MWKLKVYLNHSLIRENEYEYYSDAQGDALAWQEEYPNEIIFEISKK